MALLSHSLYSFTRVSIQKTLRVELLLFVAPRHASSLLIRFVGIVWIKLGLLPKITDHVVEQVGHRSAGEYVFPESSAEPLRFPVQMLVPAGQRVDVQAGPEAQEPLGHSFHGFVGVPFQIVVTFDRLFSRLLPMRLTGQLGQDGAE